MGEEAPKEAPEKMLRVKVRVPDRSQAGHRGYYAIQRLWPNGDSEAVIPESKLAELQAEKNFLAVVSVEPVSEAAPTGPPRSPPADPAKPPEPVPSPTPEPTPTEDKPSPGKPLRR